MAELGAPYMVPCDCTQYAAAEGLPTANCQRSMRMRPLPGHAVHQTAKLFDDARQDT